MSAGCIDGSYHSAEFIFSDFPGQNESFSLTNLFMQNTNVSFFITYNHTRNKDSETNLNMEVQIICKQSKQKIILNCNKTVQNLFLHLC